MKNEESRMRNRGRLCLLFVLHFSFFVLHSGSPAYAGELEVAKEALRDGLWEVARTHAARLGTDEARLVILESYAREAKWTDLLKTLEGWGDDVGEAHAYYRALALAESGRSADAGKALDAVQFGDPVYAPLAARLRARLAMEGGDVATAVKIVRETGFDTAGDDARMAAAEILDAGGDRKTAERIWRGVVGSTNANEQAFVAAAANLGDAAALARAVRDFGDPALRRLAGLRLGMIQIKDARTFKEGERAIRMLAKDAPDAPFAREAFLALADAHLAAGGFQAAADAYREAFDTWPDAAKIPAVQEGRGWALRKLGRVEEAVEAFARAEESATDDESRAKAALEQGDALSECGRGEEAMAKYREVLDRYRGTPSAERLKALMHLRELEAQGRELYRGYRFADAQAAFRRLGEEDPSRKPRADYFQMLCLYGQGLDREARDQALQIVESGEDPAICAETVFWLAKFAYNHRRWRESCALFADYATNRVVRSAKASKAAQALLWASRAAFAANEFDTAIAFGTKLAEDCPDAPERGGGYLVQGEALIELARFDDAILVLERAILSEKLNPSERLRAQILKADALFAMGADNPARYRAALDAYRSIRQGESLEPGVRLTVAYKIARTLEKLKLMDEAVDSYYTDVVIAYRNWRKAGVKFGDEARTAFARAAFRLADEYESRGRDSQAVAILRLVVASDVPAAAEAARRIERIQKKGKFL